MGILINNTSFVLRNGSFVSSNPAAGGGGNNLVTTDLTHWFDAGNSSSYPGSGATWTNLVVGSVYSGSLISTPAYTSAGGASYFTFDGSTDYVRFNGFQYANKAFTINMIMNVPSLAAQFSDYRFFVGTGTPLLYSIKREFNSALITNITYYPAGGGAFTTLANDTTNGIMPVATTFMLTLVSSTTGISMYKNGTFYTSSAASFDNATLNGSMWIAADNDTATTNMSLYHFLFYTSSLSAGDVLQNYNTLKSTYSLP